MNRINARRISRRAVLREAAAVAGFSIVAPRVLGLDGKAPPSEKIRLGFIGLGIHGGTYNLPSFLQQDDAQVVALCDVFKDRREKALQTVEEKTKQKGVKLYDDFRQLLADKNVDAVCISTPDHWHVPITMMALDAGLDVMCEKPTLTIAEGRALVEKVAAKKAVYQVGLEDRSLIY
jgi:predicted dehydrogenase